MTIPSTVLLPLVPTENSSEAIISYLNDFKVNYENIYEQIANGINGDIRADFTPGSGNWTPTLYGTATAGAFTYIHQSGYSLRRGLIVDAWGDIQWSATGGAAGNIYVELPYKVALSNNMPFVGVVQPSALTYTGGTGIVINGISDTFRGEFWNVGDGFTTANQAIADSATGRISFHIRYIGQRIER